MFRGEKCRRGRMGALPRHRVCRPRPQHLALITHCSSQFTLKEGPMMIPFHQGDIRGLSQLPEATGLLISGDRRLVPPGQKGGASRSERGCPSVRKDPRAGPEPVEIVSVTVESGEGTGMAGP